MDLPLLDDTFPLPRDRPFTYAQALGAGLSEHVLRGLVADSYVRRLLRGVYVAAQAPDSQLLRAQALQLVVPKGCVVTDESAGWLAGAEMILRPGAHQQMPPLTIFGTGGHDRLRNELSDSGTRQLLARDVHEVHGVLATTPLRTALDLGRLRHRDRAIGALDQMLRLGDFPLEELLEELSRFKGMRGVRQLRLLAPIADGRSESPGESVLRLRFHDAELPLPTPQVDIFDRHGRFIGRADLVVQELGYVAEYYGDLWHRADRREHDETRVAAMEEEGLVVDVFRDANVYGHQQDAIPRLIDGVRRSRARLGTRPAA